MTTTTKAGRYEIVGELGRGAMGVVYKAQDPVIGRTVAVKTIRLSEEGSGLSRPELLNRFQTEARAAGLLTHPNIVVVYDAGEEDGIYYITMELVEGKSLQALLDARQSFPLPRVLRLMEQTCSALQFAHERNVVHRDIKPANLMLTPDDTVKVTDFGTAKILQFGTVQQTAHVMGTPSYMSPEQVKGRAVDGRSDIFSLGVMLYEMITGEKPFPGQNITTVIYKIVNEDPVPPRTIDPSIHPGLSTVVMKALSKEPEQRYQTCRELLEDLRNYRSIAGAASPQATAGIGGHGAPTSTLPLNAALGGRGPIVEDPAAATVHSLSSRATIPTQTPVLRRTGAIPPVAEPRKKSSVLASIFLGLLLVGVIAYGAYKLRPVWQDAQQLRQEQKKTEALQTAAKKTASEPVNQPEEQIVPPESAAGEAVAEPKKPEATPVKAEPRKSEALPVKPEPKKVESTLTPRAAEYKGRIEEAISEHGLAGRAKVQGFGNTLTLAGRLKPSEHGTLLGFLRNAPSDVHVVDHIEYEDAPAPANSAAPEGSHPVPHVGLGAIHVVTDVIGATASVRDPSGRVINRCQTPCSFNDLDPEQYGLEVTKNGYQPVETALTVKTGEVKDQKISLESLAKGLFVSSDPAGADVFINGAKQSGQTPVTLPLAPGNYNLVLRLQGYDPYSGSVQVKNNVQTQLNVPLTERNGNHVAWAQVESNPLGAEILVDGVPTGQITPARVQVPSGTHRITLKLAGYQLIRRTFQVSEGGSVFISEPLKSAP
jgi:protein kinase-like protein/PEGA domain-containing protein